MHPRRVPMNEHQLSEDKLMLRVRYTFPPEVVKAKEVPPREVVDHSFEGEDLAYLSGVRSLPKNSLKAFFMISLKPNVIGPRSDCMHFSEVLRSHSDFLCKSCAAERIFGES